MTGFMLRCASAGTENPTDTDLDLSSDPDSLVNDPLHTNLDIGSWRTMYHIKGVLLWS